MTKVQSLGGAVVFVVGCVVGCASARFMVPPANAQQAATLTKWEYMCFEDGGASDVLPKAQKAGAEGWEMAGVQSSPVSSSSVWCFKRPKM